MKPLITVFFIICIISCSTKNLKTELKLIGQWSINTADLKQAITLEAVKHIPESEKKQDDFIDKSYEYFKDIRWKFDLNNDYKKIDGKGVLSEGKYEIIKSKTHSLLIRLKPTYIRGFDKSDFESDNELNIDELVEKAIKERSTIFGIPKVIGLEFLEPNKVRVFMLKIINNKASTEKVHGYTFNKKI